VSDAADYVLISILGGAGKTSLANFEARLGDLAGSLMQEPFVLRRKFGSDAETRAFRLPSEPVDRAAVRLACGELAPGLTINIGPLRDDGFQHNGAAPARASAGASDLRAPELPERWVGALRGRAGL
jgi:hypothetical protein